MKEIAEITVNNAHALLKGKELYANFIDFANEHIDRLRKK